MPKSVLLSKFESVLLVVGCAPCNPFFEVVIVEFPV